MPASNKTTGPGLLDRSIMMGTFTVVLVCSFATFKSKTVRFPAGISFPKKIKGLFDI